MERKRKFTALFVSMFLLSFAIFSKFRNDLAGRLTIILLAYMILSFLIEDKTFNKILRISSAVFLALIWILDKGFDYFKM